jgi:hypothetical protein
MRSYQDLRKRNIPLLKQFQTLKTANRSFVKPFLVHNENDESAYKNINTNFDTIDVAMKELEDEEVNHRVQTKSMFV